MNRFNKPKYYLFLTLILLSGGILASLRFHQGAIYQEKINEFRYSKDLSMLSEDSPLEESKKLTFKNLKYYDVNRKFSISAKYKIIENPDTITLSLSGGEKDKFLKYGKLFFRINKKDLTLFLFKDLNGYQNKPLFVPFKDNTSAHTTYGGGRYLDVEIYPESKNVILDFNLAYNPFCAYNNKYKCPLSPIDNILPIAIEAGEMKFKEAY